MVEDSVYSKKSFTLSELRVLGRRTMEILVSTPHGKNMSDLLIAVTLAQGAALHYAVQNGCASKYLDDNKAGIKNIDIWFFFARKKGREFHPLWKRYSDYGPSKFGHNPEESPEYLGRKIGLSGRSIDIKWGERVSESIRRWIQKPGSGASFYLRQQAIIGLFP